MMTAYRRWACGLLAGVLVLLIAAGAVVWAADPCFYLRLPEGGKVVAWSWPRRRCCPTKTCIFTGF